MSKTASRNAAVERKTKETDVRVEIDLDGSGEYDIATGIPFFDHMLESFAKHGLFDLRITAKGDLQVDTHHTVEDVGITLGEASKLGSNEPVTLKPRFRKCSIRFGNSWTSVFPYTIKCIVYPEFSLNSWSFASDASRNAFCSSTAGGTSLASLVSLSSRAVNDCSNWSRMFLAFA